MESIKIAKKGIESFENIFDMLFFGFRAYFMIIPESAYKILRKLSGEKLTIMTFTAKGYILKMI